MRIAVVGATGRIGAKLTRMLLHGGHRVKALSRGGPGLDALVAAGVEPALWIRHDQHRWGSGRRVRSCI